jgi:predicted O-methyltransferase YrrM
MTADTTWTEPDLHAWHVLAPLATGYAPWTSASLRPAGLVAVLNEIQVRARTTILECGGGVSTIFIARLLERLGDGLLTTLEHDPAWVDFLERTLARERIVHRVRLVHAPLGPHPLSWDSDWYDEAAVAESLPDAPIELLLVDGPPAFEDGTEHARYPALPALAHRLAPDATVVLDDIARPGEQAVLRRWEAEHFVFERRHRDGGIAIGAPAGVPALGP